MRAQAIRLFHVAGVLDVLGFGRQVVEVGDDDRLLHTGHDGRPIFPFAMVSQHAMNDALDLFAILQRN